MKTVLKQAPQQRLILRERHHAVANISGRQNTVLAPQASRASAIIGDRDNGGEVADRMTVRLLAASRDVVLQSMKQHRETRAAADGGDAHAMGARSALRTFLRTIFHFSCGLQVGPTPEDCIAMLRSPPA